jgi:hypothetical protein
LLSNFPLLPESDVPIQLSAFQLSTFCLKATFHSTSRFPTFHFCLRAAFQFNFPSTFAFKHLNFQFQTDKRLAYGSPVMPFSLIYA